MKSEKLPKLKSIKPRKRLLFYSQQKAGVKFYMFFSKEEIEINNSFKGFFLLFI